jgi:hypothetical protein
MHMTAENGVSAAVSPVASPETIPSPNIRKRPRFESKQDSAAAISQGKGKKAAKEIDRDTVMAKTE